MSVATAMYSLKPVLDKNFTINRDECMYRMKNIHCASGDLNGKLNATDVTEKNPLPDVAVLEARQEKILAQLAELKEQVLSLCDVLKVTGDSGETSQGEVRRAETSQGEVRRAETSHAEVERRDPVCVEVVVKADPSKPCYAVQALAKIWKNVDLEVACYTHSSVLGTVPEVRVERKAHSNDCVKISLIWKKVEDLEFVISGVQVYPLIGETNLLRYLVRCLSEEPPTPQALSRLNCILDLSHRLSYQESPKEIQSTLSKIGEKLGKGNFLGDGDEAGIADVAAWSAIKRTSVKLPSNLVPWFDRCDQFFI